MYQLLLEEIKPDAEDAEEDEEDEEELQRGNGEN